ncbi:MAG TPA: TetR/AcrR family transcriptional regulator [Stackebrandtia sp.]|uniref:TetR/AcrR family transcriptional regulator n=1 Tax=Stackebrandtia sp. TaxID=2023065 RepID=UPI002D6DACED|nr:TetR/AcrR family transcriptional regulator [Stackebrandtia sp.]HZE40821.1 TetR/AcrR family transcriptional regulator [Stackebrandtia sp.]
MTATAVERPLTPAARRILAVAGDLFYERGIHTVGVDLIAREAGVTKKTIYDRFGSKEALVVAYLRHRDQRWRAFMIDRLRRVDDRYARVLAVFDALEEWEAAWDRGCAMVNAYAELSDPAHPGRAVARDQKAWTVELFAQLLDDAGVRGAPMLADQLLVLHEGAVVATHVGGRDSAVTVARAAARALLAAAANPGTSA